MYARVVTMQIQPGKAEETIHIFRDSVIPIARQQQGFKGALLLTDSTTGKDIGLTLWETETDTRATETNGYYQEQIAKYAQLWVAPPTREGYQVSVQV